MDNEDGALAALIDRVHAERDAVAAVVRSFDASTETLLDWLSQLPGKVFVTGSGTSDAVAARMAHLFSVSGVPAVHLNPTEALHGGLGAIDRNDLVIGISRSGRSAEVVEAMRSAAARGIRTVALTCTAGSELTRIADLSQVVPLVVAGELNEAVAMGSSVAHAVWGDAIAAEMWRRSGRTMAEMIGDHPAGAVGELIVEEDA